MNCDFRVFSRFSYIIILFFLLVFVGREENVQKFLNRLTHLNLHGKGLKEIEGLEDCRRLQVKILDKRQIPHYNFQQFLAIFYLASGALSI